MIFVATLLAFLCAMALMAVGVLLGNRRLERGCGTDCGCFDEPPPAEAPAGALR